MACIGQLQKYSSLDRDINEAVQLLSEAAINCEEARGSLQAALSRMDLSLERLAIKVASRTGDPDKGAGYIELNVSGPISPLFYLFSRYFEDAMLTQQGKGA